MKAALALALLSLAALAAPYGDKHDDNEVSKYDDKHESKYDGKHESKYDNKHDDKHDDDCAHSKGAYPFEFTSTLVAYAGPDAIINNSQVAVPGLAGGWGEFRIGLNSIDNVICYNISMWLKGNYSSPAVTATHIHQAHIGQAGPPRLAFPNPRPLKGESLDDFSWRRSVGCLTGPFTTGVLANGTDTGVGFTIAALEADPSAFFADTHTVEFPAGAIRGQVADHRVIV